MSKNHFCSHFLLFQIDTTIFNFINLVHKMATGGHFGSPKIILIAFLAISDRYGSSCFFGFCFDKMAAVGVECPKITFDRISEHFRSIGHFGCPKFTFDRISDPYGTSFFRRPFWMSEIHLRSHF